MGTPNQISDNLIDYGLKYITGDTELYVIDITSEKNIIDGPVKPEAPSDEYFDELQAYQLQTYWLGQKPVANSVEVSFEEPIYGD